MSKRTEQKKFAKDILITMAGVGVGAVVDKAVAEAVAKAGIPNPKMSTVTAIDAVLVGVELFAAYKYRKRKPRRTQFLTGMASAVVASDIVEALGTTPWIVGQGLNRSFGNAMYGSQGRYGRTAPVYGNVGAYLKPNSWSYAPR